MSAMISQSDRASTDTTQQWVEGFAQLFRHVALFVVEGAQAKLQRVEGFGPPPMGKSLALTDQTPLRWCLESASPFVGAGRGPGGQLISSFLGLPQPRAFVVLPLVWQGRLAALIYADQGTDSLPIGSTGELFLACEKILTPATPLPAQSTTPRFTKRQRRIRSPRYGRRENAMGATVVAAPANKSRFVAHTFSFVSASAVAAAIMFFVLALAPPQKQSSEELVEIKTHQKVSHIAEVLQERGIIRHASSFCWLAKATGFDRNMRAGYFYLSKNDWTWQVLSNLQHGHVATRSITVPEGLTLKETAALFEQQGFGRADEFLKAASDPDLLKKYHIVAQTAEGFLFPETYTFALGLPAQQIVRNMVQQFFRRMRNEGMAWENGDLMQRVIIASIVERESKTRHEMPVIAGVFYNRLKRNMRLESCATVQYALGVTKPKLLLEDIRIPSPYNTYLQPGLPKGPIANPGIEALRSAFFPENHDYLFFFAKDDGSAQHVFTKTFEQHQAAQKKMRQG